MTDVITVLEHPPEVRLQAFCSECHQAMTLRPKGMAYCENRSCSLHSLIYTIDVIVRRRHD